MAIHVWGTDFRRSPSSLRTQLFIPEDGKEHKLAQVRELGFQDIVYLHTCNRVEFYTTAAGHYVDTRPLFFRLLDHLGASPEDFYRGYHLEGKATVRHLMRLSCSLESMVVGEPQILGQLKRSLQWNKEQGFPLSSSLESAFQFSFETAKKVRTETPIGARSVSIATVGMERLVDQEQSAPFKKVVLIGRSAMVVTAARWLAKRRPDVPIVWVNRNTDRLAEIPETAHAEKMSLSKFLENPCEHSHLITATASPEVIFGTEFFSKTRPDVVLDFAHPHDVCRTAAKGSELIQIEDLREYAKENERLRHEATAQAEKIIEHQLQKFYLLQKESPVLKEFNSVEGEVLHTLEETLPQIDQWVPAESVPKLKTWAEKLVKKNLHSSRKHLREALRRTAQKNVTEPHAG